MGLYYPRCAAILTVVFDNFDPNEASAAASGLLPLSGSDSDKGWVLQLDGQPGSPGQPLRARANLNGYSHPDTFELEFDAKLFPISPELIRTAQVELYFFQTDGIRNDIADYDTEFTVAGLVDESGMRYSADGRRITLSGRDYTQLLIDKKWPEQKRLPVGSPIDQTVQQLVDEATQASKHGRTLTVKFAPEYAPLVLNEDGTKTSPQKKKRTSKRKKPTVGEQSAASLKKGLPMKGGLSYWDAIYRLCLRHGLICYVRGTDVVIDAPQALTLNGDDGSVHMAYGRNLAYFEVERKLTKEATPQIVCRAYDKTERKQVEGRWPKVAAGKMLPFGFDAEKERLVTAPPGITSQQALEDYAKAYYLSVSRTEATMKWGTKALRDIDGRNLLLLRPGDPCRVEFDPFSNDEMARLTTSQRRDRLRQLGYSDDVAKLIAENYEQLDQFRRPYYTRSVALNYDHESGTTIDVEACNYVVAARDDAS